MKKIITIVSGDPNSIGYEILAKTWKRLKREKRNNIVLIGSYLLIKKQLEKLKIRIPLYKINSFDEMLSSKKLKVLDVPIKFKNPFKVKKENIKKYILKCIEIGHNLSCDGKIAGFINLPINKEIIFKNKNFGMTEYLAQKNKVKNTEVMMIYNKNFAVVPITTHVSIKDVTKKINTKIIINKVLSLNKNYLKYFRRKPKIAILGLNPHNSEGKKNSIENKIIKPAKEFLTKKKINITGPFPADTVFINNKINYDVIIGMYHDQVLAPFKAINGFDAINITLGLKYIRISPDHGVGENIIGMNQANSSSLLLSIKYLNKLVK